jgi:hypothetical protein
MIIILSVGLVLSGLAIWKAYNNKTLYVASTSFSLEDSKGGSSGLLGLASQFGFDLGGSVGGIFAGDNVMELFRTRRIVESSLFRKDSNNKLLVETLYFDILNRGKDLGKRNIQGFKFSAVQPNPRFQYIQDSIVGELSDLVINSYLMVEKPDKKLNIIIIKCRTPHEVFSQTLCNYMVEAVSNFYIDTKVGRARRNVEILQFKADSLRRVYSSKLSGRASTLT